MKSTKLIAAQAGRPAYLGESLDRLVDLEPSVDEQSGLSFFSTAERAVDPIALRALVSDQLAREPSVELILGAEARAIEQDKDGPLVEVVQSETSTRLLSRVVIDCRWEHQGSGIEGYAPRHRNVRVKAAVRFHADAPVLTATLVAGPFGDIVQHRNYAYLSWYPDARLHHEFTTAPSAAAIAALDRVGDTEVIDAQLRASGQFGWLPPSVRVIDGVGGFILGDGAHDIDHRASSLHDRDASGLDRYGDVLVPRSFKYSSAPAAARRAGQAARALVGR